eukprot:CAMPEP_0119080214 /NCGR_PEP_ID=MMETSP1178-20130426/111148_1 /TAXON_ID=33656 /ORGANISM="unid sp, Strain CCMP2000" /LENGTH=174 /DNA_ID=CAMNT_0007062803 /DNA_START=159 /DNA_END=684 /DNA_ORIENTATION=-
MRSEAAAAAAGFISLVVVVGHREAAWQPLCFPVSDHRDREEPVVRAGDAHDLELQIARHLGLCDAHVVVAARDQAQRCRSDDFEDVVTQLPAATDARPARLAVPPYRAVLQQRKLLLAGVAAPPGIRPRREADGPTSVDEVGLLQDGRRRALRRALGYGGRVGTCGSQLPAVIL